MSAVHILPRKPRYSSKEVGAPARARCNGRGYTGGCPANHEHVDVIYDHYVRAP